jgi:predicted DNA-binding transcriptional regulator AlpA
METAGLTFTVAEFCRQVRISRKTFYEIQKRGEGPKLIRLGRRVYVAQETARTWVKEREALSVRSKNGLL